MTCRNLITPLCERTRCGIFHNLQFTNFWCITQPIFNSPPRDNPYYEVRERPNGIGVHSRDLLSLRFSVEDGKHWCLWCGPSLSGKVHHFAPLPLPEEKTFWGNGYHFAGWGLNPTQDPAKFPVYFPESCLIIYMNYRGAILPPYFQKIFYPRNILSLRQDRNRFIEFKSQP